MTPKQFGARLRYLREESALKAKDIARLTGLTISNLYNVERATWMPSWEFQSNLARIYRVDMCDLYIDPDLGDRQYAHECLRLLPNSKLTEVIAAIERIAGKSLDELLAKRAADEARRVANESGR